MTMEVDITPTWLASPVKWMEDDALTSDRERLKEAWKRIYDVEIESEVLVEVYDGGDLAATLFESGRIAVRSCGLAEIRELPPGSEKPTRGGIIVRIPSFPDEGKVPMRDEVRSVPEKKGPNLPYQHFQVVKNDDKIHFFAHMFVLDAEGEIWVKPINSNGVATSSTAVWTRVT
jgi:hypothetical protein